MVLKSTAMPQTHGPHSGHFNSNYFLIGVDNHATTSISNDKSHFISLISPVTLGIKDCGGSLVRAKGQDTVKWNIKDDEGRVHMFTLQNALYVPESSLCILCLQHWAKQANDHHSV